MGPFAGESVVDLGPEEIFPREFYRGQVRPITTWKSCLEKVLDLALQLSKRVPGFAFHFQPANDFWQVLEVS